MAAELGLSADEMLEASRRLWGRSLSEERSEGLNVPLRQPGEAQITAMLRDELRDAADIDAAVQAAELREEMEL